MARSTKVRVIHYFLIFIGLIAFSRMGRLDLICIVAFILYYIQEKDSDN